MAFNSLDNDILFTFHVRRLFKNNITHLGNYLDKTLTVITEAIPIKRDHEYLRIFIAESQDMAIPFYSLSDIFKFLRSQASGPAVTGRRSSRRLLKSFVKVIVLLSKLFEQNWKTHNVKLSGDSPLE